MTPRQAYKSRSLFALNGKMSWIHFPVVLSCMWLSVLAAEWKVSVCARRGSIGTIGIAGPGGSWSGSSGAI